ncbi:MAG: T9SS type A sorting domain-containing protein, partial [Bacteroidetes bacterium]|nr:T9SS type A sorting domain-containing protein [Bacteroidota bacterium]
TNFTMFDMDRDGDQDLALLGSGARLAVFRNDQGVMSRDTSFRWDGSSLARRIYSFDYDSDGDDDVIAPFSLVRNGMAVLENTDLGLLAKDFGYSYPHTILDLDEDGTPDLISTYKGSDQHLGGFTQVQPDSFRLSLQLLTDKFREGIIAGDLDHDGTLDLLFREGKDAEMSSIPRVGPIWITKLPPVFVKDVFDFDGDGNLDILAYGLPNAAENGLLVLSTTSGLTNTPPSFPTNLRSARDRGYTILEWNSATDTETQQTGLSYNIRVGTTSRGHDIVSDLNRPSPGAGRSGIGNVGYSLTRRLDLPDGQYFWSVQSVDNSFARSAWAPEQSFIVNTTDAQVDEQIETLSIVAMYPNPSSASVTIELTARAAGFVSLRVYDLLGRTVFDGGRRSMAAEKFVVHLDVERLAAGRYVVCIQDESGNTARKGLVVSH